MTEEIHIPRSVLLIAIVLGFGMWVPLLIIPPMEDLLARELSVSHAQISLLYTGPMLMLALVGIPGGFIADVIGIKRAAGIGAILIVVGTVLRGMATDYSSLLAFMFVYGLGLPSSIFLTRLQGRLGSRKFFILGSSLVLAVAPFLVMHITLNSSWFLMAFVGIATSIRFTTLIALCPQKWCRAR